MSKTTQPLKREGESLLVSSELAHPAFSSLPVGFSHIASTCHSLLSISSCRNPSSFQAHLKAFLGALVGCDPSLLGTPGSLSLPHEGTSRSQPCVIVVCVMTRPCATPGRGCTSHLSISHLHQPPGREYKYENRLSSASVLPHPPPNIHFYLRALEKERGLVTDY